MTIGVTEAINERTDEEPRRSSRGLRRAGLASFAALAYVPLLLTDVGKIDADSKAYLYLDPGRLLASTVSLWDPKIGMGTVAYQMLGFLFPVGPFYWISEHLLGLPPWIAQRLWLGTLILAAGLGTRYLLRTLGLRGPGIAVGMVAYAFSPYAIQFSSHTSVLLPPWAAMPWMTAFVVLALRRGGWKYPALLAITVQLAGSVNASTLAFALLAPALWIPYAVVVLREVDWRRAMSVVWRSVLLIVTTSLWWVTALVVESGYARDVLRFTEQSSTTSATLYPLEVLRGLGYWIFYYREGNGPVTGAAATFMRNPAVLLVSILLPALALLAATAVRWSYRAYFVVLLLVGFALAIGSAPFGDSSPFGSAVRSFSASSTAGFALRNSARAVPLVALGLACLLAAGVTALHERLGELGRARGGIFVVAVVLVLCMVDAPGVWGRSYYDPTVEWRSIPAYWKQAATSLDLGSHETRVLALPGSPFAAYSWGTTRDPVEPALMTRPFVTVEEIPWGSDATANLLSAVDAPLQAGTFEMNALAPVARLMGAGDILLRLDLQSDRYGLIPADTLWNLASARPPAGLGAPETFGTARSRLSAQPGDVARPRLASAPPLVVLPVEQPLSIVRTKSAADPIVVDGDGTGVVDLASVGLLDARRLVLYSATFEHKPAVLRELASGAALVVTDSNRKRPFWATSLTKSYGPTEQVGEQPLVKSPYDQRLDVFPGSTSNSQTVTIMRGVKSVRATQGYHVFNLDATRPSLVLDGSVDTGWSVDAGARAVGAERLLIDFIKPITTDQINIAEPIDDGSQGRWITRVTLRFDGRHAVHRVLDESSRSLLGQTLHFPKRSFSAVEIRIDRVHHTRGTAYNAVGFQEIRIADDVPYATPVRMQEVARLPVDLLRALGSKSLAHSLTLVLSRDAMDDSAMSRQIWLPTERSFTLTGTALAGARASDTELDHFLGIPDASAGGVTASSLARYSDVTARASSAIDHDPATAWNTPLGKPLGSLQVTVPHDISIDHMDLRLVDDGRHSVPTGLRIQAGPDPGQNVNLSALPHTRGPNGTVFVPITFNAVTGRRFTFTITSVRPVSTRTTDHPEGVYLPAAIAELGIPGVRRAPMPTNVPTRCLDDLLTIDGKPLSVRVTGTTARALQSQPLQLRACDGGAITLAAGTHEIRAGESPDSPSGADVQHLVLSSAPDGAAAPPADLERGSVSESSVPAVSVVRQNSTSMTLHVDAATKPYWLVLGQSLNRGWVARADGRDLGEPTLVDGYANGWLVQPSASGKPMTITLTWSPQRRIWMALLISALALIVCLMIVVGAFARDRRRRATVRDAAMPRLRRILAPPLERRRRAIIGTVVATTALGALLVKPWVGLVAGGLTLLAIMRPRWRVALRVLPAALIAATAIVVTVDQVLRAYPAVFPWPTYFDASRVPVWTAVVLLAADALIAVLWRTELDSDRPEDDADASALPTP